MPIWFYAYIVYWLDRFEREPVRLLVGIFLWGAFVATIGAAVLEVLFTAGVLAVTGSESLSELINDAVFAPIVEESLKGIAVLIVAWVFRPEFDSLLDGIVYAGIVAFGFAAMEDVFYLFSGYQEQGWSDLFGLFFLRIILTGWNHAAFTAFTGMGIAIARLNTNLLIRLAAPVAGWALAVILHGTFNGLLSTQNGAGVLLALCISWVGWLAVFAIVIWAIAGETRSRPHIPAGRGGTRHPFARPIPHRHFRARGDAHAFCRVGLGAFLGNPSLLSTLRGTCTKKGTLQKYGQERGNAVEIERLRAELSQLASVARA